jgi:hypothetical protein
MAGLRASDRDRDQIAEQLRDAFAEGRLTSEEHEERLDKVYKAKTIGELQVLISDLPAGLGMARGNDPRSVSQQDFASLSRQTQPILALFGETRREGRWLVPSDLAATAVFGEVKLDLREAVLERGDITIVANAVCGSVTIRVPPGVVVQDEGTAMFGSRGSVSDGDAGPGTPVIRVRGVCLFGEVRVKRSKSR